MIRAIGGWAVTLRAALRWTVFIAAGFATMAVVLFAFIYWQAASLERQHIDDVILRESAAIVASRPNDAAQALKDWLNADPHEVRYGGLFGPGGERLAGNLAVLPDALPEDGRPHESVFPTIEREHDPTDPEDVRAIASRLADGRLLVLGYDIDELEDVQDVIGRALALGLVLALLLSLLCGTLIAWRAQRRVASMHGAIGKVMRGALSERLPVRGSHDDLDRLAGAVNGMLRELERLVGDIRGVGDSIAHDLRTPLTRARARLERCRDEAQTVAAFQVSTDRAIASLDQALAVISAVLRIGEIEHGRRRAAFATVDLGALLRDAAELYEPLADEKNVSIRLDLQSEGHLVADRDLMLEAIGNLLDNAIKFTPAGSAVTLSLVRQHGSMLLRVADRGPGIAESERERAVQRFYRGEKSRTVPGSGLGLSLVAAVVRLHGLRLVIGGSGAGCVIEIVCPDSESAAPADPGDDCADSGLPSTTAQLNA
ncbi:MAG: HAMP domain-containing protein [Acetobacteraceae bacterium]|nr:HAMP domain-containing protein [Acetobacteraceae bacterium]